MLGLNIENLDIKIKKLILKIIKLLIFHKNLIINVVFPNFLHWAKLGLWNDGTGLLW